MSDKNTERDDQANELRKLFNEVQGQGKETSELPKQENTDDHNSVFTFENSSTEIDESVRKIDILNLPPRREVHGSNKKRARMKISRPFARFSVVILIIFAIIVSAYYVWGNELIK
ncbi:hypothetical protein [Virgibacillus necropolis]|uniref:Uncharacterized protein n=1 Tax=Virgibacillus necropolis TaxID=163877 RepID=A0A221MCT2_9BACI|nr:hypothetical protein [Virgibacillus necropolis]ASN05486.1 hypothetical protein CFK40_10925 [Virgibacillus necropolis]